METGGSSPVPVLDLGVDGDPRLTLQDLDCFTGSYPCNSAGDILHSPGRAMIEPECSPEPMGHGSDNNSVRLMVMRTCADLACLRTGAWQSPTRRSNMSLSWHEFRGS